MKIKNNEIINLNIDKSTSNIPIKNKRKNKLKQLQIKNLRKSKTLESVNNVDLVFGLDNGTTGTMCSWNLLNNEIDFKLIPSIRTLNYQQKLSYIDRIDFINLQKWFIENIEHTKNIYKRDIKILAVMERPMVNPQRFTASLKAVRSFQACLIILELLHINYLIIDSKKWQHYFFGNTLLLDLKKASQKYGNELLETYKEFNLNNINEMIEINLKHGDADALLIARYTIEKLLTNDKK